MKRQRLTPASRELTSISAQRYRSTARCKHSVVLAMLAATTLVCSIGATGDGSSRETPGVSCRFLMEAFELGNNSDSDDGFYWVEGHPKFGTGPKKVYCLMDNRVNKGGWMGVLKTWYTGRSDVSENGDRGNVDEWLNIRSSRYMLGAGFVRHIIGESNEFDIMGAQNGYLPSYSTGNYEYVTIENYKAKWSWNPMTQPSSTTTTFKSFRWSDHALAWQGNFDCAPNFNVKRFQYHGIYCRDVVENNPQGGCGCKINMGVKCEEGWHHFVMYDSNSDSYLYICNGPQHTRGSPNIDHIFYVRERNTAVLPNPTGLPTQSPTVQPITLPSSSPTAGPSARPTKRPSRSPTKQPTGSPSKNPSVQPTGSPSKNPSVQPTGSPSKNPSEAPTKQPTTSPTRTPTAGPTGTCNGEPDPTICAERYESKECEDPLDGEKIRAGCPVLCNACVPITGHAGATTREASEQPAAASATSAATAASAVSLLCGPGGPGDARPKCTGRAVCEREGDLGDTKAAVPTTSAMTMLSANPAAPPSAPSSPGYEGPVTNDGGFGIVGTITGTTLDCTDKGSAWSAGDGSYSGFTARQLAFTGAESAEWKAKLQAVEVLQGCSLIIKVCLDASSCDNLSFFDRLRVVSGDLHFFAGAGGLSTLNGTFPALVEVGGSLLINENMALAEMSGAFARLATVGGNLHIYFNPKLAGLGNPAAFATLKTVQAQLYFYANGGAAKSDTAGLGQFCDSVKAGGALCDASTVHGPPAGLFDTDWPFNSECCCSPDSDNQQNTIISGCKNRIRRIIAKVAAANTTSQSRASRTGALAVCTCAPGHTPAPNRLGCVAAADFAAANTPLPPATSTNQPKDTTPDDTDDDGGSKSNSAATTTVAVVVVAVILVIGLLIAILLRRRQQKSTDVYHAGAEVADRSRAESNAASAIGSETSGMLELLRLQSPAEGATIAESSTDDGYLALITTAETVGPVIGKANTYTMPELAPLPDRPTSDNRDRFEIDPAALSVDRTALLGKGHYGVVCKGTLSVPTAAAVGRGLDLAVAVKMLPQDRAVTAAEKQDLWEEIKFLRHIELLGGHQNIIRMHGYASETAAAPEMLLVLEFAERGSLLGYLRSEQKANLTATTLPHSQAIVFAAQVASAMTFVEDNKLVHRDLAARNVLLDRALMCKVTDFGLARDVYESSGQYMANSRTTPSNPTAWKWTSLEGLLHETFTIKGDVWSYGVVLWEICSLGANPYPGYRGYSLDFINYLKGGGVLQTLQDWPPVLVAIMERCWKLDPSGRPSFSMVAKELNRVTIRSPRAGEASTADHGLNSMFLQLYVAGTNLPERGSADQGQASADGYDERADDDYDMPDIQPAAVPAAMPRLEAIDRVAAERELAAANVDGAYLLRHKSPDSAVVSCTVVAGSEPLHRIIKLEAGAWTHKGAKLGSDTLDGAAVLVMQRLGALSPRLIRPLQSGHEMQASVSPYGTPVATQRAPPITDDLGYVQGHDAALTGWSASRARSSAEELGYGLGHDQGPQYDFARPSAEHPQRPMHQL